MARQPSTQQPPHCPFTDRNRLLLDYLARDDTPLYTLDELAERLALFGLFLDDHQDFITDTGLPPFPFRESRWLYLKLGRLYDTRATRRPWPHAEIFGRRSRPDAPPYEWSRSASLTVGPGIRRVLGSEPCEYGDADFLNGMDPRDGYRLESIRPGLFAAKRRVVELVACAVCERSATDLLRRCVGVLAEQLRADDLEFLLAQDRFYLGRDVRHEAADDDDDPKLIPGGITDVLEVIGHVEQELTLGTLAAARAELTDPSLVGRVDDQPEQLGAADQAALLDAVNAVVVRREGERAFWADYRKRVSKAFESEFRIDVVVPVRPRHLDRITPLVGKFADHLETLADGDRPLTTPFDPQEKPVWDGRGTLYFRGVPVRRVRVRKDKKLNNVLTVLNVCQEEGWTRIDDPTGTDPEKRHETVKSLNDGLEVIEFFTSGEGFDWRVRTN